MAFSKSAGCLQRRSLSDRQDGLWLKHCATNAPLGSAVTHGLGFPLNPILAFLPPLSLFKFRRDVNLSLSFPAHHVRPLLQSMHCHGQLCCSLSAPASRRLKLLESHGRYITARQCARGAQVPTSAYCGGPFITRPVYPDVQRGLVHCSMPKPTRPHPSHLSLSVQPLWEVQLRGTGGKARSLLVLLLRTVSAFQWLRWFATTTGGDDGRLIWVAFGSSVMPAVARRRTNGLLDVKQSLSCCGAASVTGPISA